MIRLQRPEQAEIDMNQDAIHRIFEGNADAAKQLLVDCIERAKRYIGSALPHHPVAPCASLYLESVPLLGSLGPEDTWYGYNTRSFLLYRHLFGANFIQAHAQWSAETASLFCAAASYNLAMIYHHQGITEGEVPALSRARSFYCVSLDLLTGDDSQSDHNSIFDYTNYQTVVLTLALYNNLGHLHSFLDDHEGVVQCRQDLEQKLASHSRVVDDETVSFFQSSLLWGNGVVPPKATMA